MPSSSFIAQVNAELQTVAKIWLVTIVAGATTIRLCSDYSPVVSRGNTYTPYPHMDVGFPEDASDRPPRQSILLEDVGREVIAALRLLDPGSPPTITIELVLADALDTVQDSWTAELRDAQYDLTSIDGEIRTDEIIGVGAPLMTRTPSSHPALFAGS